METTVVAANESYDIGYAFLDWVASAFHFGSEHFADHLYQKAVEILFEIVKLFVTNRVVVFIATLL